MWLRFVRLSLRPRGYILLIIVSFVIELRVFLPIVDVKAQAKFFEVILIHFNLLITIYVSLITRGVAASYLMLC